MPLPELCDATREQALRDLPPGRYRLGEVRRRPRMFNFLRNCFEYDVDVSLYCRILPKGSETPDGVEVVKRSDGCLVCFCWLLCDPTSPSSVSR